ncbi:hypothetical protein BC629DRAFT_488876 [Irpex lacteus]|nr:hypothetical protein BC629DRAFT_488876 [Irpex lacteus]
MPRKRRIIYERKTKELVEVTLGPRLNDMYNLSILATHPRKQRRGYASSLVREVLRLADAEGRDTWVLSSNTANNKFYASLGFATQTELVLGRDDATWSDLPVVFR